MDHSKKMRLSEIPSLMVMQVMLWTAAYTELTVMLKHMEKGHMKYYYNAEYDRLQKNTLDFAVKWPTVFQALMREYLSLNKEYLHSEGYTQKELDEFRQALDDSIPPMHQVDDEEADYGGWCHCQTTTCNC